MKNSRTISSVLVLAAFMEVFVGQSYCVELALYSNAHFRGNEQVVRVYECQESYQLFLGVSSVRIRGDCVRLCSAPGVCHPINRDVANLESIGLNDIISTICPCTPRKRMMHRERLVRHYPEEYLGEDELQGLL